MKLWSFLLYRNSLCRFIPFVPPALFTKGSIDSLPNIWLPYLGWNNRLDCATRSTNHFINPRAPLRQSPYTNGTDASETQVGTVLLQEQPDWPTKPIIYFSRSCTPSTSYKSIEHQGIAILSALVLMIYYLEGSLFTVRNKSLCLTIDIDPLPCYRETCT